MRRTLRVGIGISAVILVMASTVSPTQAAAPKPGTACKTLGQKIVSGKLTYTCTKSGSKLIWSKGYNLPLRVITKTFPAAISGRPYRAAIEVSGGTGYHFCNLQKGSGLPPRYSLNPKTCVITGIGEILPVGTTMRVSPPFTIIVTDSSTPKKIAIRVTTSIVTYPPAPVLTVIKGICRVSVSCAALVATATGGTAPYTFRGGSAFPPLGLVVMTMPTGAYLTGVARVPTYKPAAFEVCVTDAVGRQACKTATVDVLAAPIYTITVAKTGDGQGTVVAGYGNINCGDTCQGEYVVDSELTLSANPTVGSVFTGWTGDCTGTGSCTLKVDANKSVAATFTINASGTYSGTAIWPATNVPGYTGCNGGPHTNTYIIEETEGGKITVNKNSDYPYSGSRTGNVITVTMSSKFGLRGPYVWQWDGTTLAGTDIVICFSNTTGALLNEATYPFSVKRN